MRREEAEALALQALHYISAQPERISRFLALSGLEVQDLRRAAAAPEFLAGVLDHLISDEALLLEFAADAGIEPQRAAAAQRRLAA